MLLVPSDRVAESFIVLLVLLHRAHLVALIQMRVVLVCDLGVLVVVLELSLSLILVAVVIRLLGRELS